MYVVDERKPSLNYSTYLKDFSLEMCVSFLVKEFNASLLPQLNLLVYYIP